VIALSYPFPAEILWIAAYIVDPLEPETQGTDSVAFARRIIALPTHCCLDAISRSLPRTKSLDILVDFAHLWNRSRESEIVIVRSRHLHDSYVLRHS
jgi:hypothetical protein